MVSFILVLATRPLVIAVFVAPNAPSAVRLDDRQKGFSAQRSRRP